MTQLTGQTLGRYQILEQLGTGGMAAVYKAYDTRLGRYVALKVMHPAPDPQPGLMRRFELEARALAQLGHPAIVRVLDYGEEAGWPFLVLEYIPGGTLKDRLASGPQGTSSPFPWQDAARFLAPIARGLEYAHQHGIIHRDVKPSNILISPEGQPLLSDFGIAKTLTSEATPDLTGTGMLLGTPEYMSPEQCQGGPVDYRTDIYSLGVVFYEMITGHKPFTADSQMAVMHRQIYDPLPPPRQFVQNLPQPVEQVLYRALSKNPQNRYQTMGQFAAELEELARGRMGTIPGRKVSRTRGRPSLRGIGALLGILAAALLLAGGISLARPILNSWLAGGGANNAQPSQQVSQQPSQQASKQPTAKVSQAASNAWKQGKLAFTQKQDGASALMVMDLGGTQNSRLLYAAQGKHAYGADWAPDGRHLAYFVLPNDLRMIDTTSESPSVSIASCNSPSWASDGKRIVCASPGGTLLIIQLDSGQVDSVANAVGNVPVWSPARDEIAYSNQNQNNGSNIWRTSLDTHESISLTGDGSVENFAPAWSPDGKQIAYQSTQGSSQSEIWVMGRDGKNPHQVTKTPGNAWSRGATWSPDGLWLAYVSNQADSIGADFGEVFIVSLQSGQVVQVTHTGGMVYDWRVSWSQ